MGATTGLAMPVGGSTLDQIGEEGDRLPEGYKQDGVIALETF